MIQNEPLGRKYPKRLVAYYLDLFTRSNPTIYLHKIQKGIFIIPSKEVLKDWNIGYLYPHFTILWERFHKQKGGNWIEEISQGMDGGCPTTSLNGCYASSICCYDDRGEERDEGVLSRCGR